MLLIEHQASQRCLILLVKAIRVRRTKLPKSRRTRTRITFSSLFLSKETAEIVSVPPPQEH